MRFAEGSRRWTDGGTAGTLKAPQDRPAAVAQTRFNLHTGTTDACIKNMVYPASSANQIIHEMQLPRPGVLYETPLGLANGTSPGSKRKQQQCGLRMKRAMIIANGKLSYISIPLDLLGVIGRTKLSTQYLVTAL